MHKIENARVGTRRQWALVIVMVLFTLIAGCGNKGDLYLPDEAPPAGEQGT